MPVVFTEATLVAEELQVPPVVALLSAVVEPAVNEAVPVIDPTLAEEFTVTAFVAVAVPQLLLTVYVILAVPLDTPVTTPVLLTMAMPVVELLHVPPPTLFVNVVVLPGHTVLAPVIVPGLTVELTVTVFVAVAVPQLFVTE